MPNSNGLRMLGNWVVFIAGIYFEATDEMLIVEVVKEGKPARVDGGVGNGGGEVM
ncbi:hypothetical protein Ancab_006687, partial [Ancistrocladus abbreviatus]